MEFPLSRTGKNTLLEIGHIFTSSKIVEAVEAQVDTGGIKVRSCEKKNRRTTDSIARILYLITNIMPIPPTMNTLLMPLPLFIQMVILRWSRLRYTF